MKPWVVVCVLVAASILPGSAQDESAKPLTIVTKDLPKASLWSPYTVEGRLGLYLKSSGGVGGQIWRINGGALPRGMQMDDFGHLSGTPLEAGEFTFLVDLHDARHETGKYLKLEVEQPLAAAWSRKSQVNGNRIEGSIKVSNTTGRDFDLTFDVLAVNDIGRATAIGYQHFTLKKNTRDMDLPFGDTLSPGSYVVNIDVVAEEPQSKMIFRSRMVAPKQTIAPVL